MSGRGWTSVLGPALLLVVLDARAAAPAMPPEAVTCQACHGAHGEGIADGNRPRLAAQSADYLEKQLRDFASGARENAIMGGIAKTLNDRSRARLAAYFAAMPLPAPLVSVSTTAAQAARGHQLAAEGAEPKRVQACNNCHGPEGNGAALGAPGLAGQLAPYLAAQLKAWQQGTRKNDAGSLMSSVATKLDDADITAITSYYAGLDLSGH